MNTTNSHLISHNMNHKTRIRRRRRTRRREGRRRNWNFGELNACSVGSAYMKLTWHVRVFADMADDVMAVQIHCNAMFQLRWVSALLLLPETELYHSSIITLNLNISHLFREEMQSIYQINSIIVILSHLLIVWIIVSIK
jgi:hypothetical protein